MKRSMSLIASKLGSVRIGRNIFLVAFALSGIGYGALQLANASRVPPFSPKCCVLGTDCGRGGVCQWGATLAQLSKWERAFS